LAAHCVRLRDEPINKFLSDLEICGPKARERVCQIQQSASRRSLQDTEGAYGMDLPGALLPSTVHLVKNQLRRPKFLCEQDRLELPASSSAAISVASGFIVGMRTSSVEPCRRAGDPAANHLWRTTSAQFVPNGLRNDHQPVELGKYIDLADAD
jgi:hypothetical protein